MATMTNARPITVPDTGFFLASAIAMAAVLVIGFSTHLALGRSSFAVPPLLHAHALLFFGWTAFYVLQNGLAATWSVATHRRLGWLAAVWVPLLVVIGFAVTIATVRAGTAPFFFTPLYFLILNPLTILTFAGLTAAAIVLRRRTQWHRRLMFCGMALLTGPGFGRLLPLPFAIPYAGWTVFAAIMLFPLAGVIRDLRRDGVVHPAWWWGIGAMVSAQVAMDLIANSALGLELYRIATDGSPGALVGPHAYPAPPAM